MPSKHQSRPTTFYRVQSKESQTLFWTRDRSFHTTVLHDPSTLFDFTLPNSLPSLVTYAHMHLNNELMNTPFISLDCCPYSTLNRAKLTEQKRRTGVFIAEVIPSAEVWLWNARELAKMLDGMTAPQFQVVRRENWGFTKNEWLAMNEIPSEAVGRSWTVKEFEDTLTQLQAMYGKKRTRKLKIIPTGMIPLPTDQQQTGSIDGSSLAGGSESSQVAGEVVEGGALTSVGVLKETEIEYSHFGREP